MAQRIYISKLIGDGLSPETAFRPAWIEIIGTVPHTGHAIDSEKHNFWIGTLDTTTAQHDLLVADNRVRNVPDALFNVAWSGLTQNQKNAIIEVFTYLGLPTNLQDIKVVDILAMLVGRACFHPIKNAVDAEI